MVSTSFGVFVLTVTVNESSHRGSESEKDYCPDFRDVPRHAMIPLTVNHKVESGDYLRSTRYFATCRF
jgi:hypothetical protein